MFRPLLTCLLLVIVMVVGTYATSGRKHAPTSAIANQNDNQAKWRQREEEAKKHFPTADFNEPDPSDPSERVRRKQKQARHNGLGLVSKHPEPDSGGGAFLPENQFSFPGLPVEQSSIIVVGEVLKSEAHLSEDKTAVYSEFTIRVQDSFKGGSLLPGSEFVVERLGGYVEYPDGRKLLYRVGTGGMPRIGSKYLFFLNSSPQSDSSILTAYELSPDGVRPLDSSAQFEQFRGYDEKRFLASVREALNKN